jgi:hypothetical protein
VTVRPAVAASCMRLSQGRPSFGTR